MLKYASQPQLATLIEAHPLRRQVSRHHTERRVDAGREPALTPGADEVLGEVRRVAVLRPLDLHALRVGVDDHRIGSQHVTHASNARVALPSHKLKTLHEMPSPSSDWAARQPHARWVARMTKRPASIGVGKSASRRGLQQSRQLGSDDLLVRSLPTIPSDRRPRLPVRGRCARHAYHRNLVTAHVAPDRGHIDTDPFEQPRRRSAARRRSCVPPIAFADRTASAQRVQCLLRRFKISRRYALGTQQNFRQFSVANTSNAVTCMFREQQTQLDFTNAQVAPRRTGSHRVGQGFESP